MHGNFNFILLQFYNSFFSCNVINPKYFVNPDVGSKNVVLNHDSFLDCDLIIINQFFFRLFSSSLLRYKLFNCSIPEFLTQIHYLVQPPWFMVSDLNKNHSLVCSITLFPCLCLYLPGKKNGEEWITSVTAKDQTLHLWFGRRGSQSQDVIQAGPECTIRFLFLPSSSSICTRIPGSHSAGGETLQEIKNKDIQINSCIQNQSRMIY